MPKVEIKAKVVICIGYKSRIYNKGYWIMGCAIENMLRKTIGTWGICWEPNGNKKIQGHHSSTKRE